MEYNFRLAGGELEREQVMNKISVNRGKY